MSGYVLQFEEIDRTQFSLVGGKGANLGELSRIEGVCVPSGFCVTTKAFERIVEDAPSMNDRLERLSRLGPEHWDAIRELSAELRNALEAVVIPEDVIAAIARALDRLKTSGLVQQISVAPEPSYRSKHALTQEVV